MFYGNWSCKEDVARDFNIDVSALKGLKILHAEYNDGDYCGDAMVIFRKGRKLFEVHGSHCSCYGLEDQWDPSEVSLEQLKHYAEKGYGIVKDVSAQFLKGKK